MGRRPVADKRLPSDYPLFSFRTTAEKKHQLGTAVEHTQTQLNRRRKENEPHINKNDVIVKALEIGLATLKKR